MEREQGNQIPDPPWEVFFGDEPAPKRRPGRPATGQTPVRTIRIGPIWDEAKRYADERGESFAEVVAAALRRYVQRARRDVPRTADTDQGIDRSP